MNLALKYNLEYLLDKEFNTFDKDLGCIYLKEYKKTNDRKLLAYIEKINESIIDNKYLKYSFLIGYDTIINRMHNYHSLVPEILSLEIVSIEDLFMFHEILSFINTMMYDEYDQIRKKYQNALVEYSTNNSSELLNLLIKMSVASKYVNVSLLENLSEVNSNDNTLNLLNEKYDKILNEKGMYDLYML